MLKKKILLISILIFSIFILVFLTDIVYSAYINKTSLENSISKINKNNDNEIFKINKIVFFSSCNADTTINNSSYTITNLFQYTDIAIYINNSSDNFTNLSEENTLKSVYIDNINFNNLPQIGSPSLYYKNINLFSKGINLNENKITDKLFFDVTSEDDIDYNEPILFNNCANPITLSYINSNIKNNYILSDFSTPITYDGSLLQKSNILLNSIDCNISFDIYITNNLNQQFKCPIYINIPLDNNNFSIYDGSFTLIDNTNYIFYRYK